MIYLCPGKNPLHFAFKLKNRKECTLDYEHGVLGGSRTDKYFECSTSETDLDPQSKENGHRCAPEITYYSAYGPAIDYCYEDQYGRLWAGNGEYSSMVNFCPFCGIKGI